MLNKLDILSGHRRDPPLRRLRHRRQARRASGRRAARALARRRPSTRRSPAGPSRSTASRSLGDLPENARRYVSAPRGARRRPDRPRVGRAGADADDRAGRAADADRGGASRREHGQPPTADPDPRRGRWRPRARARLEARPASPGVNEVIVAPGQRRDRRACRGCAARTSIRCDGAAVVALARREAVELVVIGPEAPLAAGVADALAAAGIAVVRADGRGRPDRAQQGVLPRGRRRGRRPDGAGGAPSRTRCRRCAFARGSRRRRDGHRRQGRRPRRRQGRDGLRGPRRGRRRALAGSSRRTAGRAPAVVVEERLVGREASVIALVRRRATALALPAARDHKRLARRRSRPEHRRAWAPTARSPTSRTTRSPALVEAFHRPILAELARRGTPFRGALYAGLMLTADGPVLLECNARFGDPGDAGGPAAARPWPSGRCSSRRRAATSRAAAQALGLADTRLPVFPGATVAIVLAAAGLPGRAAPRRRDRRARRGARPRAPSSSTPARRRRPTARSGPPAGACSPSSAAGRT